MTTHFSIKPHTVHLWRIELSRFSAQLSTLEPLLSADEKERAARFHGVLTRERYIVARALLRKILHLYIEISPEKIVFSYSEKGKPFLSNNAHALYFNVSHSHDRMICALSTESEIGVDIEKMELDFKENIAKRFFSKEEYAQIENLPKEERVTAFYRIWSRKEAVIKAFGAGLFVPMGDKTCHVENFSVHPDYQAAFATFQPVDAVFYWEWKEDQPAVWRT